MAAHPAVHRSIVVVDVEGFGDSRRTNADQVAVRDALYRTLRHSFDDAGVPWANCAHEDRGDGVFLLIPAYVPKSALVEALPRALAARLRTHNDTHPAPRRIRLRMVLHAGEVVVDEHGVTAAAVNLAFRLLDSRAVRAALAESPGALALITSGWFFDEVVRHSEKIDPATFRPVRVAVKETVAKAWVGLPDHPYPPAPTYRMHRPFPRRGYRDPDAAGLVAHLDAVADTLAMSVRDQWAAEEQVRRVHDPFPLPARWTSAPEVLMDHWPVINGAPGRSEPVDLSGHGDHIVETFDRVPSRRLVVLGRAGAGKTVMTTRFVLTVLADRSSGARRPVPVIFALGSWDPTASTLRDWQVDQLTSTYPILAERDTTGTTLAATLLATGRIMAVLDGFDEISAGLRADAIVGINASLRPGEPMLLTSRTEEYGAAVRDADVLTAAAVVRLADLTPRDVADYLPLTTRKPGPGGHANKWTPVLDLLPPTLAAVLTTPLMISLARAIYSDTDRDPRELLDHTSATEIEDHLLAGFVPALYSRAHPPFAAVDVGRWLGFLATHLRRLDTYDLAWWRLTTAVPRAVPAIAAAVLIGGLITGMLALLAELGAWPATWRTTALAGGGIGAAVSAAGGAMVVGRGLRVRPTPSRIRLRLRGRFHRVLRDLADGLTSWRTLLWFVSWSAVGGAFGFAGSVVLDTPADVGVAVVVGFAGGLGAWLVVTVLRALGTPVHPADSVGPEALLRTDRATALSQGLLVGLCVSPVIWLAIGFGIEPALGIPFGHAFPPGAWVLGSVFMIVWALPIWALSVTVWGPWLIARTWLALTGQLPWPVMTFLRDAHRRGLLRQSGGVYQFRHARLQHQLAQ